MAASPGVQGKTLDQEARRAIGGAFVGFFIDMFDIFQLRMNKRPQLPIILEEADVQDRLAVSPEQIAASHDRFPPAVQSVEKPDARPSSVAQRWQTTESQ